MESNYIPALAALAGSSIGALSTITTAWLSQSYQHRIQRRTDERARREQLFGEFIDEASRVYSDALTANLDNPSKLVGLYSIKSRISLFASDAIIEESEEVIRKIVNIYINKSIRYSDIGRVEKADFNILQAFTIKCKQDINKF